MSQPSQPSARAFRPRTVRGKTRRWQRGMRPRWNADPIVTPAGLAPAWELVQKRPMLIAVLFVGVCFLAYSNGANDNFKGVASLFGSRTCGYRTAISWATATTFAGSVVAIFFAKALLEKFSGRGLVPDTLAASPEFLLAVAVGAGGTVILATVLGFPISTTHALTERWRARLWWRRPGR